MIRPSVWRACAALGALLVGSLTLSLRADQVALVPVADTTLIEEAPMNNSGGVPFVNAGTTQNFTRNRGLFRFDLRSGIPAGASVTSAEFIVEVVGKPKDGFAPSPFGLHRLLKPWGEGTQVADPGHPGLGAAAGPGEATWTDRFAFTTNAWNEPGGAPGSDFVAAASAEATVYGLEDSPYTFGPTPALAADVQTWIDTPDGNFGWALVGQTEPVDFTARRFASREDASRAALLRVAFLPPPRIEHAAVVGSNLVLQFTARAGQVCVVESRERFASGTAWLELTNVPAPPALTNVTVVDPLSPGQRFYRLRLP